MAQTPKYDNDMVNLGYLNKRLGQTEESINENNNSISQLPKNYSIPPNPPYYKDSLLCYGNKIYKCNTTKLKGEFSWNDWTIVATDDTTISDFINNTYELDKLEIQEQIDGKVQTYYQENDPSKEWTTELDKGRHIGDYWYNTTNDTQWRYNRIITGSVITYGWGQVNIPKAVFDTIDSKKSIYTEKPTSYQKDDLWIIEESLSDEDLPVGTEENPIAKGDWVFSIANSDVYNKEHWVKRDEDISMTYIKQHYYTIGEINSSFEEIERNTDSKITKAKDEISLNVSQTYTTKEEHEATIYDFDEKIGTINQTITEHKETISDLSIEVGEITSTVESIEETTKNLEVNIDGVSADFEDFKDNEYIQSIDNLQKQIDGAIQFWNGAEIPTIENYPANEWTTENDKINHQADIYTVIEDIDGEMKQGKSYRFDKVNGVWQWIELTDNELSAVQALAQEALNKANANATEIGTVKTRVSSLEQTDEQIKASVESIDKQIIPTYTETGSNIYIEDASDDPLIQLEIEGKSIQDGTPTPDAPVEIESVGYENLANFETDTTIGNLQTTGELDTTNINYITTDYKKVKPNTTYTLKLKNIIDTTSTTRRCIEYDSLKEFVKVGATISSSTNEYKTISFTTSPTTEYIRLSKRITDEEVQLEEGSTEHSYIPYSKYGIEVKTVGKNKIKPIETSYTAGGLTRTYNADGSYTIKGTTTMPNLSIPITSESPVLKSGKSYTQSVITISGTKNMSIVPSVINSAGTISYNYFRDNMTKTPSEDLTIHTYNAYVVQTGTIIDWTFKVQLEENPVATEYTPYQSNTLLIVLNEPLRSLPNGVKDRVYIKNNKLYVDRYISSVVFDGSENWWSTNAQPSNTDLKSYGVNISGRKFATPVISDCYAYLGNSNIIKSSTREGIWQNDGAIQVGVISNMPTLDEYKTWLSTHNTQVDYELATPVTEEYGEIEIPSTFKGVNHITTTDELEPTLNIEYVRDTVLSKYVEGQIDNLKTIEERHYAELVIEDNNIKAGVTEISSSVNSAHSNINSVEAKLNSQQATIEIISTNIDTTTGEVRGVTTSNGITLDKNGLNFHSSEDSFNTQIDRDSTEYRDGDELVSMTSKDGFLSTDSKEKGTHYYSYNEKIPDEPLNSENYDFIDERIEEDGEVAYATFWNGEE